MYKNLLVATLGLLTICGCARDISSNHYSTNQTGRVSQVEQCTVINVRYVSVNSDSDTGTLIGSVAGGVAGSTIGSGSTAAVLGAVGGALVGGFVGDAAEKGLSSQSGLEYVVKLNSGRAISVTQGTSEPLAVGQKCLVLYGQQTRIIADY